MKKRITKSTLFALALSVGFMTTQAWSQAQELRFSIAGCNNDNFVDIGDNFTMIDISGFSYTPKCLRVKAGSTIQIQASSRHPLRAMSPIDDVFNPFESNQPFTRAQSRVLNQPGFYGYFCLAHGSPDGGGMSGIIQVVP